MDLDLSSGNMRNTNTSVCVWSVSDTVCSPAVGGDEVKKQEGHEVEGIFGFGKKDKDKEEKDKDCKDKDKDKVRTSQ